MATDINIRTFESGDWQQMWPIIQATFQGGETYAYSPNTTESQAHSIWIEKPTVTYIAERRGRIIGTYYLKPNQPDLGSHICNCGYMVSAAARGQGIASNLCEHSQEVARDFGFQAMQFNLVVSTNEAAVYLWKKHGFSLIGTLPKAFNHVTYGLVDAHIFYKDLWQ